MSLHASERFLFGLLLRNEQIPVCGIFLRTPTLEEYLSRVKDAIGQRQGSMTYHTINAQRRFFDSVCCKGYDVILLFEKFLGNKTVFQYADISKEADSTCKCNTLKVE